MSALRPSIRLPLHRPIFSVCALVICALSLPACGGDDDSTKPTTGSTADVTSIFNPVVAMGADGVASVAYIEEISNTNVYAAEYGENGAYIRRVRLSNATAGIRTGETPAVERDASGWAIAAWRGDNDIVASTHDPRTGMWSDPVLIGPGRGSPAVAMDGSGNGWLVWDEGNDGMSARRFVPGGGWQDVAIIDPLRGRDPLVEAYLGVATAVWWAPSLLELRSSRYDPAGGWSAPEVFTAVQTTGAVEFHLAMNRYAANAMAAVVYARNDSLFINRYIPGSGWTGDIFGDVGDISGPRCAMEPSGVVTVVYRRAGRLAVRRHDPGFGWGSLSIRGDVVSAYTAADVAAGGNGFAFVAWRDNSGITATALTPTSGWSPATVVSTRPAYGVTTVRVASSGGLERR